MEIKVIRKNGNTDLAITACLPIDGFELGQLQRDLDSANVSHSIIYDPPEIRISLTGEDLT